MVVLLFQVEENYEFKSSFEVTDGRGVLSLKLDQEDKLFKYLSDVLLPSSLDLEICIPKDFHKNDYIRDNFDNLCKNMLEIPHKGMIAIQCEDKLTFSQYSTELVKLLKLGTYILVLENINFDKNSFYQITKEMLHYNVVCFRNCRFNIADCQKFYTVKKGSVIKLKMVDFQQ